MPTTSFADTELHGSDDDMPAPSRPAAHTKTLTLSLQEHDICMVIPAGARIDGHRLDLPGGVLILGALRGTVHCAKGSAIIAAGGEFQGDLEAENIYIEGRVTSSKTRRKLSMLKARGRTTETQIEGGLLAMSGSAKVTAHMLAHQFHIPRQASMERSTLDVLTP